MPIIPSPDHSSPQSLFCPVWCETLHEAAGHGSDPVVHGSRQISVSISDEEAFERRRELLVDVVSVVDGDGSELQAPRVAIWRTGPEGHLSMTYADARSVIAALGEMLPLIAPESQLEHRSAVGNDLEAWATMSVEEFEELGGMSRVLEMHGPIAPCPAWCEEAGHHMWDEETALGRKTRWHIAEYGSVAMMALECEGERMGLPHVEVTEDACGDLSPAAARQLALALLDAADAVERVTG